jgi:hypothetical protein
MKKTILMMLACFLSLTLHAQNAVTVQPKIMVVPYVTEGVDIRQTIESDPNIRVVMSKIREAFDKRGFTTVDFEAKLKAQSANNALSQGAQSDLKSIVIQGSGADIFVEAEYVPTFSSSGNSVKIIMKAVDVSTGSALASKDAYFGPKYTEDMGVLAGIAMERVADEFLSTIQMKFNDIVQNGRSINIDFKIGATSSLTMNTDVGSDSLPLSDVLEMWMGDHAYQNNYHIQGTTDLEMIFDDVRIPLKDHNGNNYNINKFGLEILKFVRSLGFQIDRQTKNNTLVITFK